MRFLILLLLSTTLHAAEFSWSQFKLNTLLHQGRIPGWCTIEKAEKLMDFIYEKHPKVCVEIGVFGGSSIYPICTTMRLIHEGVIYAIDPWATDECLKGFSSEDSDYMWWNEVDLDEIYDSFQKMLKKFHLETYCHVMRMTSESAVSQFADESIDLLHIDGNHSEDAAFQDIQLFLPKVKKGGYIWFDDANKLSTKKAITYLLQNCSPDRELKVADSVGNECQVFVKNR